VVQGLAYQDIDPLAFISLFHIDPDLSCLTHSDLPGCLGFAVLLDPGIIPQAEKYQVIFIEANPLAASPFMVGVDHTDRAPDKVRFLFCVHGIFPLWYACIGARFMPLSPCCPHIYGFGWN
jgi:hypothetical protein